MKRSLDENFSDPRAWLEGLFRAAIDAQSVLWPVSQLTMKIITGPRLPEDE